MPEKSWENLQSSTTFYFCMLVVVAGLSALSSYFVKVIGNEINPFIIVGCQSVVMLIFCLPVAIYFKLDFFGSGKWIRLVLRALTEFVYFFTLCNALQYIPLGNAF